jgi:outer membrane protein assembly factor BamB
MKWCCAFAAASFVGHTVDSQDASRAVPTALWTVPIGSHSFGSGAAADVNGDGVADIAFATYFNDARVRVLSGVDGGEIWSYHDPDPTRDDCYDASCKFADVNDDGALDLVVPCSSGCRVLAFDAATGDIIWNTYLGDGDCTDSPPWIGDADGDGATDVVVGTFRARLHVLRGGDGAITRTLSVAEAGAVQTCPVVMDVNGDGVNDYIAGIFARDTEQHGLYALSGADGSRLWRAPLGDSIYHGPAVGSPRADRQIDLAVCCYDGNVYLIDAMRGEILWQRESGSRYIMSPAVMADLDGAGPQRESIIVASESFTILDGEGAAVSAPQPVSTIPYDVVTRGVSAADLDGDGALDFAYLTSAGIFRVVNRAGEILYEFDATMACGEGKPSEQSSHGPILADFNGDGRLDAFFVVGGGGEHSQHGPARYGMAICLTGFTGKASATNSWMMIRHDAHNTGNPATPVD